jgi:hypothetical protein
MKKIGSLLVLMTIIIQAYCQDTIMINEYENPVIPSVDEQNGIKVVIGNNLISYEDGKNTYDIRVGKRGIRILESLEGPKFDFVEYNNDETPGTGIYQDESEETGRSFRRSFKGHWSGIEFGFNNYLTADHNMILPDDIYYMSVHSGKSTNFNINFAQLSLGLTRHIGIVTGLGFNFNDYIFEGNNNIIKGANGAIEPYYPTDGTNLEKSKLATSFIDVPILIEIQIPTGHSHHLNIAGGGILAAKIGSHSKIIYEASKQRIKDKSDFSLNMLRYGATARVGYGMFQLYGTYYLTPLFKTGKGPELYPFEVGVSFSFEG